MTAWLVSKHSTRYTGCTNCHGWTLLQTTNVRYFTAFRWSNSCISGDRPHCGFISLVCFYLCICVGLCITTCICPAFYAAILVINMLCCTIQQYSMHEIVIPASTNNVTHANNTRCLTVGCNLTKLSTQTVECKLCRKHLHRTGKKLSPETD